MTFNLEDLVREVLGMTLGPKSAHGPEVTGKVPAPAQEVPRNGPGKPVAVSKGPIRVKSPSKQ